VVEIRGEGAGEAPPDPTATPTTGPSEGKSAGPPWWDACYRSRRALTLRAGNQAVPEDYTFAIALNHAEMVSSGLARADGSDLRILAWDGSSWIERDRVVDDDSGWNRNDTHLLFQLGLEIPAGGSFESAYLYSGCPSAGAPPEDPTRVYWYYSGFGGPEALGDWKEITLSGESRWFVDDTGVLRQESDDEYKDQRPYINFKLLLTAVPEVRDLHVEYDFRPRDDDLTAVGLCADGATNEGFYVGQTQEAWFDDLNADDQMGYWLDDAHTGKAALDFSNGNWYEVRVSWTQDLLELWFDGVKVGEWNDGPDTAGPFCLALNGMGGLHIDNLALSRSLSSEPTVTIGPEALRP
jgi:hypothetical protein